MEHGSTFNLRTSYRMLFVSTIAFTICFAVWMLNGVLVTYLAANQVFAWGPVEIGWLMGIPVLTGAIFRLPAGILTDRFGGRPVLTILILICAVPMYLLSFADSFLSFALCSFGFGLAGASFSVGIAFCSIWFPKEKQGLALGIFGAGNAGAAFTSLIAPTLLNDLTNNGTDLEQWRRLPEIYAMLILATGIGFFVLTKNKKPEIIAKTMADTLAPLKEIRVWRFGLYYFLVFGCFVAFAQWLVPYFVNVYYLPLVTAGILAALFSFPSGVIRALGGWMSDTWGARKVMYWVLGTSVIVSLMLIVPKMEIYSSGRGIMATQAGTVTSVNETEIVIGSKSYSLVTKSDSFENLEAKLLVFPTKETWQEAVVKQGDEITKSQLIAKGITRIYFQANVWIFAVLVIVLGIIWGIGKAAVYKHIPQYYPNQVGVVGGMVGVIGGLGGFICPIIFGYLLEITGLWTSAWMFMFIVSLICLLWMHQSIMKLVKLPFNLEEKFASLVRVKNKAILKPILEWNEFYKTDIKAIDHQHKHMMELINTIYIKVENGEEASEIYKKLNDLVAYTEGHFTAEEYLLKRNHCPNLKIHESAHVLLMKEITELQQKVLSANKEELLGLISLLRFWFPGHVLEHDQRDAEYLHPIKTAKEIQFESDADSDDEYKAAIKSD